jgi:hypothetical protein
VLVISAASGQKNGRFNQKKTLKKRITNIEQEITNIEISDHQQSWGYELGPSKGPGSRSAGGR